MYYIVIHRVDARKQTNRLDRLAARLSLLTNQADDAQENFG